MSTGQQPLRVGQGSQGHGASVGTAKRCVSMRLDALLQSARIRVGVAAAAIGP